MTEGVENLQEYERSSLLEFWKSFQKSYLTSSYEYLKHFMLMTTFTKNVTDHNLLVIVVMPRSKSDV